MSKSLSIHIVIQLSRHILLSKSEFVKLVEIFCNNEGKGEHFMVRQFGAVDLVRRNS